MKSSRRKPFDLGRSSQKRSKSTLKIPWPAEIGSFATCHLAFQMKSSTGWKRFMDLRHQASRLASTELPGTSSAAGQQVAQSRKSPKSEAAFSTPRTSITLHPRRKTAEDMFKNSQNSQRCVLHTADADQSNLKNTILEPEFRRGLT